MVKHVKHNGSLSYVSGSSEDLGEDDSCQTVTTVIQCGSDQLQKMVLVLQSTQVQQATKTKALFLGFIVH